MEQRKFFHCCWASQDNPGQVIFANLVDGQFVITPDEARVYAANLIKTADEADQKRKAKEIAQLKPDSCTLEDLQVRANG